MKLINALATAFQATPFDVFYFFIASVVVFLLFYFIPLRKIYEVAFGAIVGLGIYVLLRVLLLENSTLWTAGWLLPFNLSVFLVSIAVYFVIILAIIFPLNWGLVISETTNPVLYVAQYIFLGFFVFIGLSAVIVYMTEQVYVFQVGTIFSWLREWSFYQTSVRTSNVFKFLMSHQNIIIPLGVILMIYKIFLSNIVSAIVLTIIYNLSKVGLYRKNEESSYRVEFHEIGWNSSNSDE